MSNQPELTQRRLKDGVKFSYPLKPGQEKRERITGPTDVMLTSEQEKAFGDLLHPKGYKGIEQASVAETIETVDPTPAPTPPEPTAEELAVAEAERVRIAEAEALVAAGTPPEPTDESEKPSGDGQVTHESLVGG